jgi:hypothetical protein
VATLEQKSIRSLIAWVASVGSRNESQVENALSAAFGSASLYEICNESYHEAVEWLLRFEETVVRQPHLVIKN